MRKLYQSLSKALCVGFSGPAARFRERDATRKVAGPGPMSFWTRGWVRSRPPRCTQRGGGLILWMTGELGASGHTAGMALPGPSL